ncbi:hypothetical protein Tco_0508411 [Tanacetum coccineum]
MVMMMVVCCDDGEDGGVGGSGVVKVARGREWGGGSGRSEGVTDARVERLKEAVGSELFFSLERALG